MSQQQIQNLVWEFLTGDRLYLMKLPARLLLAALTLSIGSLTPIVPPQMSLADSHVSDRCASMNTGRCQSCPPVTGATASALGTSCCTIQSTCCALYFARAKPFIAGMHLIGTIGFSDERGTTRADRPPVPPPRCAFS